MPYSRPITNRIKDLTPPQMGQPLNSGLNTTPSSFNDLVGQFRAIDESGWVALAVGGQNVGGKGRFPLGDNGNTFTHTATQQRDFDIEIPQVFTKFSFVAYVRAISSQHFLSARLEIDRQGTIYTTPVMVENGTSLGTNPRPWMFSGQMQPQFYSSGQGVDSAKLVIVCQKNSPLGGSSATNQGNFYWDGFASLQLKFFR